MRRAKLYSIAQSSFQLGSVQPGLCACGCGRATKVVAGKHLKHFRITHNPNYQRMHGLLPPRLERKALASDSQPKRKRGPAVQTPKTAPIPPRPLTPSSSKDRLQSLV